MGQMPLYRKITIPDNQFTAAITCSQKEQAFILSYLLCNNEACMKLNIPFEALQKTGSMIEHAATQTCITELLSLFTQKQATYNQDVDNPIISSGALGDTRKEWQGLLSTYAEKIKSANGDQASQRRAQAILAEIRVCCQAIAPPTTSLASETKTPAATSHRWQEHRLRLEQQLLMEDSSLTQAFHQALTAIAKKGAKDHVLPKNVFICYAWPDQQQLQDQHLSPWLPTFLSHLRDHLRAAGLTTQLDIKDVPMGGNRYDYMDAAETADFVLLIGTETLLREHKQGLSPVCAQLISINRKRVKDREAGKYQVLPLLLSGDYQTSFPPHYDLYTAIENWKGSKTYFQHICRLVATLYSTREESFQSIWDTFLTATTQDQQLVLERGLDEKAVLDYLEAEKIAHQKLATQQAVASRSMLGLDNSGEIKEVKRLLPAFASKQTHASTLTDSWHLPPRNDHYFTGRVAELKKLNETFAAKKEVKAMILSAVSGLGGVGKTQLAIYHLHHPEHPYALRIWFQAETDRILHKEYLEFAQHYKLPLEEKAPRSEVIQVVKRFLAKQSSWLVVYDNAGSYHEIKDFLLDELNNGHRIITTRRTEWHDKDRKLEVDVFSEEEAIAYIKKLLQRDNTPYSESEAKALIELVREVGYLPLALAQAGAYIKKRNKTIENYLTLYRAQTAAMLGDKTLPLDSNVQPVAATWNISLKAIQEDEATEIKETGEPKLSLLVLQAMSYLHSDHIPFDLLARWLHTAQLVKDQKVVERSLDKALGYLSAYSMIQSQVDQRTLSVHRLVQEVVRFQLQQAKSTISTPTSSENKGDAKATGSPEQSLHALHAFLLNSLTVSSVEEFNLETQVLADEKRQKTLQPHLQTLAKHCDAAGSSNTLSLGGLSSLLGSIGNVFDGQSADAAQAKLYFERALKIQEQHFGKDHWQVAGTLNNLSNTCGTLGDVPMQKQLLERALKILEQHYGKNHWQVAKTLGNLASACGALGDVPTKKQLLERALEILEQHYGKDHWQVAITLNNLATAYGALGDVPTKKQLLKRALEILEQHYGKDHWQIAITLDNLANVYGEALGGAPMQKHLLGRVLKIQEQHYGKDDGRVAKTLNNLANAWGALGDVPMQKQLLERALKIEEQHYGKDHWEVAITLSNLATAYGALGDVPTKKQLLERALKILEPHYGKDDRRVAKMLNNLATAYGALGDASTEKQLLERALKIEEQHYGKDHWEVAITLSNLAIACGDLGDVSTKKQLLEHVLKIEEQHYGKEHWQVAVTLDNLGSAYGDLGDVPTQKQLLERALKIKEQHYGKDHWKVAITLNNLANAYQQLGNISAALNCARETYRIFTTSFENPDHPHTQIAKENLQILQRLSSQQQSPELKQTVELASQTQQAISDLCQPGILALLQQGDTETAHYYFESANVNFDDSEVHIQLAEYYAAQKHFSGAIIHLEQALTLAQHAKEPLVRLSQFHGQLACVYLCHHAELKQTGKPLAEQQQAQTMAKKHFEEGIKGLADFKATDASFLLKKDACYTTMIAQAVGGSVITVRQVLESYTKTLAAPPAEFGAGDATTLIPEKKQEQKRTASGTTVQSSSAQLSDNPHRFLASISTAPEVKTDSPLAQQTETSTEDEELQQALKLSLSLNQKTEQ